MMVSDHDQNDDAEQLKHFRKISKQDDGSCASEWCRCNTILYLNLSNLTNPNGVPIPFPI